MKACRIGVIGIVMALTGCAGVFQPMGNRVERLETTLEGRIDDLYGHPLEFAYARIAEWNEATRNIQGANNGAIGTLTALSGALVYRTARNKTGAATAALATTGLVGLSLSDALVQVGRLNTYEKGSAAMECAIYAYKGAGGALPEPASRSGDAAMAILWKEVGGSAETLRLESIHEDNVRVRRSLYALVDEPFGRTVSRITHEVHDALISSIVTLQSKESTWSFTVPQKPSDENVEGAKAAKKEQATPKWRRLALENPNRAAAIAAIADETLALNDAAAQLEVLGPTYLQKLDACSIATPVASANGSIHHALAISPRKGGTPLAVPQGGSAEANVEGGEPPYEAAMVEASAKAAGVSVELSRNGAANIATVTADKKAKVGDVFTVIVEDRAKAKAMLEIKIASP